MATVLSNPSITSPAGAQTAVSWARELGKQILGPGGIPFVNGTAQGFGGWCSYEVGGSGSMKLEGQIGVSSALGTGG